MSSGEKGGIGIFAGLMMVLTLIMARDSLPVLTFLFEKTDAFWRLPMLADTLIAAVVGAFMPAWLPHAAPRAWPAHRTKRVVRLAGFCVAAIALFAQYPTARGAMFALFAGSMAYMLWTMIAGTLYRMFPDMIPSSLIGGDVPGARPKEVDPNA